MSCEQCPFFTGRNLRLFQTGSNDASVVFLVKGPNPMMLSSHNHYKNSAIDAMRKITEEEYCMPTTVISVVGCYSSDKLTRERIAMCSGNVTSRLDKMNNKELIVVMGEEALKCMSIIDPSSSEKIEYGKSVKGNRGRVYYSNRFQCNVLFTMSPGALFGNHELYSSLADDITKGVKGNFSIPIIKITMLDSIEKLYKFLKNSRGITTACDIETTSLIPDKAEMMAMGFCIGNEAFIIPTELFSHIATKRILREELPKRKLMWFNGQYDTKVLRYYCDKWFRIDYDTMLLFYANDEGRRKYGLKHLVQSYYNIGKYSDEMDTRYKSTENTDNPYIGSFTPPFILCPPLFPIDDILSPVKDLMYPRDRLMCKYGSVNFTITIPVFNGYTPLMGLKLKGKKNKLVNSKLKVRGIKVGKPTVKKNRGLLRGNRTRAYWPNIPKDELYRYLSQDVYYTYELHKYKPIDHTYIRLLDMANAFSRVECNGGMVDWTLISDKMIELGKVRDDSKETIRRILNKPDHNPDSSPQNLKEFSRYYNTTIETLDKEYLEENKEGDELLQALFNYRLSSKLVSTFFSKIRNYIWRDGRLHTNFRLTGTVTGRTSCSEPNIQQFTEKGEVKHIIKAPPNCMIYNFDYSQLEYRVMASLSGDKNMIQAYIDGDDLHEETRLKMGGNTSRREAKAINFGVAYGMGLESLMRKTGWSRTDAELFTKRHQDLYPLLYHMINDIHTMALTNGYVENPFGRRRRFPFITGYIRDRVLRQAFNFYIQSTAADICLNAFVAIERLLRDFKSKLLFTVHDSVVVEIRDDEADVLVPLIKEIMEKDYPFNNTVKYKVDVEKGRRWGK